MSWSPYDASKQPILIRYHAYLCRYCSSDHMASDSKYTFLYENAGKIAVNIGLFKAIIIMINNTEFERLVCNTNNSDIIMGSMASQITSLTIVSSTVCSGVNQRKQQSSASLAFMRGIHRWSVNSPHKWPATRKIFPFDDVIMKWYQTIIRDWPSHALIENWSGIWK